MAARKKKNGPFSWLTDKKETYRRSVPKSRASTKRAKKASEDSGDAPETWTREEAEKALARWKRKGYNPAENPAWPTVYKTKAAAKSAWYDSAPGRNDHATFEKVKGGYVIVPRSRWNPEDTAAALSEAWHGRAPKTATDIIETVRYHGVLTELGQLQEIKILVTSRKAQAITFDEETFLAGS